jgi:transposase
MDVIHPRCAGIDCSKKDAKVCVRIQGRGRRAKSSTVTTWGATTAQILALREHQVAANRQLRGDRIHQRLCAT